MIRKLIIASTVAVTCVASALEDSQIKSWEDLALYNQHPEWLLDAKFGMYTHWGPSSVANSKTKDGKGHGQYAMLMYNKDHPHGNFKYHKENWGDQNKFGYKDIIPLFKGENFDATEWAKMFKEAGAKFAGPVAAHHDGFFMWDSDVSRWNSMDMGPKRDISGELSEAIRKEGMTFIGTFHHNRTWSYMENSHQYDGLTPGFEDLYWPHEKGDKQSQEFLDWWYESLKEYIDKYEPKYLWFDFALKAIDEKYQRKFLTYYYNKGREWGQDVLVSYKGTSLPKEIGMLDFERMRPSKLEKEAWMTDGSTGPWFYYNDARCRTGEQLVHELIDIVCKNGCLLLNVPPKMDGSIPEDAKNALAGLGDWLRVNGEAIYGTRPWKTFGEGPVTELDGDIIEKKKAGKKLNAKEQRMLDEDDHRIHLVRNQRFSSEEIRFTRSKDGNTLYAIAMGIPSDGKILIKTLKAGNELKNAKIDSVELIGCRSKLEWKQTVNGLEIVLPKSLPCAFALSFRVR